METIVAAFKNSDERCLGCLVVNTLAQLESDDVKTRELLEEHFRRLDDAFRTVLTNENKALGKKLSKKEIDSLAKFVTISVQGLASYFRTATSATPLRQYARTLMVILEARMRNT